MAVLFPDAISRPTKDSPAVRDKALGDLCREVEKWWREKYPDDTSEINDIRGDLATVLEFHGDDGYQICRDLEQSCGWSPDSELVDVCDRWSFILMKQHHHAIRAWVQECNHQPAHACGVRVRAAWGGAEIEGTICRIDRELARYTIQRAGDGPGCGAIVDYEKVLGVIDA